MMMSRSKDRRRPPFISSLKILAVMAGGGVISSTPSNPQRKKTTAYVQQQQQQQPLLPILTLLQGEEEDGMTFNEIKRRSAELMIPFFFPSSGKYKGKVVISSPPLRLVSQGFLFSFFSDLPFPNSLSGKWKRRSVSSSSSCAKTSGGSKRKWLLCWLTFPHKYFLTITAIKHCSQEREVMHVILRLLLSFWSVNVAN